MGSVFLVPELQETLLPRQTLHADVWPCGQIPLSKR